MNTKRWKSIEFWVHNLFAAFIGGGASAISAAMIDPEKFNLQSGLGNLGKLALVAGIVNVAMFLKQSPLPPLPTGDTQVFINPNPPTKTP